MALDVLEAHTNIPLIDLLIRKIQFRGATRVCALPPNHPPYLLVQKASTHLVQSHRSPLHYLLFTMGIKPDEIETVFPF